MKLASLQDLLVDELRDLYNAENQILKALPKMARTATSPELETAFVDHRTQTEGHVERLEEIFSEIGANPKGKTCKGMKGLIEEGKEVMEEEADPSVMDAALIAAAQRVEHYEIAGYGCVRTYAEVLGHTNIARLLQETLHEEEAADKKLSQLAESLINVEAAQGAETEVQSPRGSRR